MTEMSEAAKAARNAYYREYARKNREKRREAEIKHWERKAANGEYPTQEENALEPIGIEIDIEIGARISSIRESRGLSMEQLGRLCGCSGWNIRSWEHGERRLQANRVPALCKALNVSSDTLLGIDGTECEDLKMVSRKNANRAIEIAKMYTAEIEKILQGGK